VVYFRQHLDNIEDIWPDVGSLARRPEGVRPPERVGGLNSGFMIALDARTAAGSSFDLGRITVP